MKHNVGDKVQLDGNYHRMHRWHGLAATVARVDVDGYTWVTLDNDVPRPDGHPTQPFMWHTFIGDTDPRQELYELLADHQDEEIVCTCGMHVGEDYTHAEHLTEVLLDHNYAKRED